MTQRLLLTEPQADFLADAIEEAIETAHGLTVENDEASNEYRYGCDRLKALYAVLEQFDPENPILSADCKPGHEFDWEAFWERVESEQGAEEDEEDAEDDEEPVAAPSPPQATNAG